MTAKLSLGACPADFGWPVAESRQQTALLSYIEVSRIMGFLFLATVLLVLLMRRATHERPAPAAD